MGRITFRPGTRIKIGEGAGLDSGKTGTVIRAFHWRDQEGAYSPPNPKREVPIQLDNGRKIYMFKNYLSPITSGYKPGPQQQHSAEPFAGDTRYYVDDKARTAVPVWQGRDRVKGWVDVYVGGYKAKARAGGTGSVITKLLEQYYPTHTKKLPSTFIDSSYHSPLNQGRLIKYQPTEQIST